MTRRTRELEPDAFPTGQARPRVLVEEPDGAERYAAKRILERAGFEVSTCAGPEAGHVCPEVERGECPVMDQADVVWSSLDWHREDHRDVLRAHRARHPSTPVVVEIGRPAAERSGDLLEGREVVHLPVDGTALVAAVERVLAR